MNCTGRAKSVEFGPLVSLRGIFGASVSHTRVLGLVRFIDRTVPVEWADSLELLASKAPPEMDPKVALMHAAITINRLCDYEDQRRAIEKRKE